MKARYSLAAVAVSVLAAFPASASVLSASGQAVGTRPTDRADYLRVTQVQDELNASTRELADEAVASGALSSPAPASGAEGGYITYEKEGTGGKPLALDFPPLTGELPGGRDTDRLSLYGNRRNSTPGSVPGGTRGGNGNRSRRGGAHPTPEPATWMMLGAGLAFLGGYAMLRRRQTLPG